MPTSSPTSSGVRTLLAQLIDDAGLFPPAALAMGPAVERYLANRAGGYSWLMGRFIVPASRLDELVTLLRRANPREPVRLSVIIDSDPSPRAWFGSAASMLAAVSLVRSTVPYVAIEVLEAALPPLATKRDSYDAAIGQFAALAGQAGLRDLPIYLEIPRDGRYRELLEFAAGALGRTRLGAKLRCGGLRADAFPSVEDVAAFVGVVTQAGVPFKATAGLHHPIRHLELGSGFWMHGFLNVLAASTFAPRVDAEALASIIAEEDSSAFTIDSDGLAWRDVRASAHELVSMRERFVSYGSCSLSEPIDDLITLGVLSQQN